MSKAHCLYGGNFNREIASNRRKDVQSGRRPLSLAPVSLHPATRKKYLGRTVRQHGTTLRATLKGNLVRRLPQHHKHGRVDAGMTMTPWRTTERHQHPQLDVDKSRFARSVPLTSTVRVNHKRHDRAECRTTMKTATAEPPRHQQLNVDESPSGKTDLPKTAAEAQSNSKPLAQSPEPRGRP